MADEVLTAILELKGEVSELKILVKEKQKNTDAHVHQLASDVKVQADRSQDQRLDINDIKNAVKVLQKETTDNDGHLTRLEKEIKKDREQMIIVLAQAKAVKNMLIVTSGLMVACTAWITLAT